MSLREEIAGKLIEIDHKDVYTWQELLIKADEIIKIIEENTKEI